jgi:hypothetical protein
MSSWSTLDLNQRLDALIHTAVTLTDISSRKQDNSIDLDWFLAGGQLIDAGFAIKKLIRSPEQDVDLVHLLFLSTLCTFVVQGRPSPMDTHIVKHQQLMNWESCIESVIQSADPKSILALASIHKVNVHYHHEPLLYLRIANTLAQFIIQDGTWVKGGVGWIH